MISNLLPQIKRVLQERPDLARKKNLKILLRLGAMHTRLFLKLKEDRQDTSRKFNSPIITYSYIDQGRRALGMGKSFSDDLAAHGLLDYLLQPVQREIRKLSNDTNIISDYYRKIISEFSYEEIRDVFSQQNKEAALIKAVEYFDKKEISFPKSQKEMINFLEKND